jgi:hypothetical protein
MNNTYLHEMKDMWEYEEGSGRGTSSIVGYEVKAADGNIGTVIEESSTAGGQHVVVDAGFWVFDMTKLIPAGVISRVDHNSTCVALSMTRAEIRDAPDFVEESRSTDDDESYRRSLAPYYQPWVGP